MKYLLPFLLLLTGCRAGQVLTTDTAVTDSTRRQMLEQWTTITTSADGRTITMHEVASVTEQARRETTQTHKAPAPAPRRAPWYDRWARWIALGTIVAAGSWIYLKFFSPLGRIL